MTTNEIYAVVISLLAAASAGIIGSFALMKKMTLAGDVISHIALPGLGLAFLFKINPIVGGAATLILGTIMIWSLEKETGLATETTIGVIFAASVALGALITPREDLIDALFGAGFEPTSFFGFLVGLAIVALIVIFLFKFKNKLMISLFSPELALAAGINVNRMNLFYLLSFSLTVILGLQFLGALLVGALIIVPAAIGRQLARSFETFLIASSAASVLSVTLGIFASSYLNISLGPTIICIAAILFALSLIRKR